jgi:hypothetical protein
MKIKTSELKDLALDYVVAMIEGYTLNPATRSSAWIAYSTDWSQGGPIIEREGMALNMEDTHEWQAAMWWDDEDSKGDILMVGPTPLIAAMRCYVASKLGDEVEIPELILDGEKS